MKLESAAVIIGLDWADRTHVCCLYAPQAKRLQTVEVKAEPEAFGAWLDAVEQAHPGGQIVVAIERPDGAAVQMMRARARWVVVPVNPVVLHRFRQAFTPSGAKGDPGDAALLGEIVRTHPEKFTPLPLPDERLERLEALVRQRRHLVDMRTALVEQLSAVLKAYYPQALELAGSSLSSPMALELLERWPDLAVAKRARWSAVQRFYRRHHCGRDAVLKRRGELLKTARAVSTADSYVAPLRLQMLSIVRQMAAQNASLAQFETAIAEAYAQAPGRDIIDSLPGLGEALGPRLWVACQQAGARTTSSDLALKSGVAPVQQRSGEGLNRVLFRRSRPRFLHQTWVEFAKHSVAKCTWAAEYCAQREKKGHGKNAIHRALAFKWTRIVARCWRDRVHYDETLYLHQRTARLAAA